MSFPSNMVNSRNHSYYKCSSCKVSFVYWITKTKESFLFYKSINYILYSVYYIPHRLAMADIISEKNERAIVYLFIQLNFFLPFILMNLFFLIKVSNFPFIIKRIAQSYNSHRYDMIGQRK